MAHEIEPKDESVLDALFRLSTDLLVELSSSYTVVRANKIFCSRVGISEEGLKGTLFAKWIHHSDAVPLAVSLEAAMNQGISAEAIARVDGRYIEWKCTTLPTGVFLIGRDVSDIKSNQEKLHKLAYYDSVTNLPNRVLFQEYADKGIQSARRKGQLAAIVYIDVNKFKEINDTYGHAIGDEVIQTIASYLTSNVRADDMVTRLGGDEFAVFMSNIKERDYIGTILRRLSSTVHITIEENRVALSLSVGVAIYPSDGEDTDSLLSAADRSMYEKKKSGNETNENS